ncbi:hypothetical protein NLJ89_g6743 [Agrocybe chaxingu]|uniref:Uncharacterized protein n=1 Tax=Agrocybe chaxingu TaxID=84603 RepID=A0A9W8MSD7_9AGAR|nr:hypothetical protein NLJ89_g6743 [Agrocybe chaxingu]
MGKAKKTRKFAAVKRMLNPKDIRLKENQLKQKKKEEEAKEKAVRRVPQMASSLFLAHNTALVPPYRVLIDTNFINFSLQNKLELIAGMMDCLYAKCTSPFQPVPQSVQQSISLSRLLSILS